MKKWSENTTTQKRDKRRKYPRIKRNRESERERRYRGTIERYDWEIKFE